MTRHLKSPAALFIGVEAGSGRCRKTRWLPAWKIYDFKEEEGLVHAKQKIPLEKRGNEQKILTSFCSRWLRFWLYILFFSLGDQILLALFTIMEAL